MITRKSNLETKSSNPVTRYLEWKSEEKTLAYYDKLEKKNVMLALPLSFIVLDEKHAVAGWNDGSKSGIYSNEVKYLNDEELKVQSFKGGVIAEGYYSDIKETIANKGGHYCKSIYVMLDGELCNIKLKGSAVQEWGDFVQKNRRQLINNWVCIKEAESLKKGRVNYSIPKFEFCDTITGADEEKSEELFQSLESYRRPVKEIPQMEGTLDDLERLTLIDDDDVPF